MAGSRNGEVLTRTEDTDSNPGEEGTIAKAVGVLGWLACQGGQHVWIVLESGVFFDRACSGCERVEYEAWDAAAGQHLWKRYSLAAGDAIRARILEEGTHWYDADWDDYYSDEG